MTKSQIDDMLKDVAWVEKLGDTMPATVQDLCCHVKALAAEIEELKKKNPLSSLNFIRVSQLTYPILMAQMEGEISEAKAAELIGTDIVSLRMMKSQTIKSIMDMLEQLPSPLSWLLESMKDRPKSSTKK